MRTAHPGDNARLARMSIIEEGPEKHVRMANLAIIGSHSVNGVAAIHTEILKNNVFRDFYELWPEKFNNKTNGITQRRWLKLCNPKLSDLISSRIGEGWTTDLYELKKLAPLADDAAFQEEWRKVKSENKRFLAGYIWTHNKIRVNVDSLFDCHVKRMHEYKRQLLNLLHVITLYNRITEGRNDSFVPRTVIFGGKAAPGYFIAKLIIKLINSVADVINNDHRVGDALKVVFLRNYCVSNAEKIIPGGRPLGADIHGRDRGVRHRQHEVRPQRRPDHRDPGRRQHRDTRGSRRQNIFIFGLTADEVMKMRYEGYDPSHFYNSNAELRRAVDMIRSGYFQKDQPDLFRPIVDALLGRGDQYMRLADYESYIKCQERVSGTFQDKKTWTRMCILNVAGMGMFSTDRTIREYADEIWNVKQVRVALQK